MQTPAPEVAILSSLMPLPSSLRQAERCILDRAVLRDRWGRQVLSFPLKEYSTVDTSSVTVHNTGKTELLDRHLSLVRTASTGEGVLCSFSDGSDLLADGVLFCDGANSQGRKMLQPNHPSPSDPLAVTCWTFSRQDLLHPNAWEFRTALGKSVEQLPLPGGKVRVKLRFRSPYAARQTPEELRLLFSEFGPDIDALLEGVVPEEITVVEERSPGQIAFSPTPATLALGEAALGVPLLGSFDWSARLVRRQMERVVESVVTDHWDPTAFEPHNRVVLEPILKAERYLRRSLHYDNVVLRPLRDVLLRFSPQSLLADKVQTRLHC